MALLSEETFSGLIERVTFHNPETGFCVLKVKAKGHKDLVAVVGSCAVVTAGEWIQAQGYWFQDRQHGQQFKASNLKVTPPTTLEGIEKYLGSGMIKGIGPVYASKLIKAFGENVFSVIEDNPGQLKDIPGIGDFRANRIISGWSEQKSIRDIMLFLHSHGISTSRSVRIYKTYGEHAIEVIRENPYRLAEDIYGIGFISADKIAASLGIEKTSLIRARAGVSYALSKAMDDGHCGLPTSTLIESSKALLDIDEPIISQALSLELGKGAVIKDAIKGMECIFLAGLYRAEKGIAERLQELGQGSPPWPVVDAEKAIGWVEQTCTIDLSSSQKEALKKALQSKTMIITGGPGVGKTTLLRSLLKIIAAKNINIVLAAPTGRAAKRLKEATGLEAKTIHRLLEVNSKAGGFKKNEAFPLDCDMVVIDESSMVDVSLFYALLKAIPPKSALLLVGDSDQLPSVGPGQVLADMIASQALPCIHLKEVFRQAATSNIVAVAHTINRGIMPKLTGYAPSSDFFFLNANEPEDALNLIVDLTTRRLPDKLSLCSLNDIQILCPMSRGTVGARNLNMELQKALNPPNANSIQKFGWNFSVRDKVMQMQNNYQKEVYNGDIGIIKSIDKEEGEVVITFDGRDVPYDIHEMDEITLSYAMTIHKSQGSEYPCVIIPLMTQHYTMLQKNLIYTAITRGKSLVIIVGQKKAVAIATRNNNARKRWSLLEQRLRNGLSRGN
jgi:exodeoxyribonuclease V alpha subunit